MPADREPSASTRCRSTPASASTRRRARARSRSTRRPPTSSRTRSTRPTSSTSTASATPTTRIVNPTNAALEERMAMLEGGVGALATASGMAAHRDHDADARVSAGDGIVSSQNLYGGTHNQFALQLPRFGVDVRFVDPHDLDAVRARDRRPHARALRRDDRQPAHRRARHRGLGADRRRRRPAARDRQHLRDALPVPAVRARRAHRACTRRPSSSAATARRSAA